MLVYAIAIIVAVTFGFLYQISRRSTDRAYAYRNLFLFASFLTLFIVSAFRVNVGTDYEAYVRWFNTIVDGGVSYFEPGFQILIEVSDYLFQSPRGMFLMSSLLTLGLVFLAIRRYSVNPALSIFLFTTLPFYFYSFNALRQYIALAIIVFFMGLITEKRPMLYGVVVILAAVLFHKSALVMLPFYVLLRYRFRLWQVIGGALSAAVLFVFQDQMVAIALYFYPNHVDKLDQLTMPISEIFTAVSIFGLAIYMHTKHAYELYTNDMKYRVAFNVILAVFAGHVLLYWVPGVNRIFLYVDIMLIFAIPYLIAQVAHEKLKLILIATLVALTSIYTYISIGVNNTNNVVPYKSELFGDTYINLDAYNEY